MTDASALAAAMLDKARFISQIERAKDASLEATTRLAALVSARAEPELIAQQKLRTLACQEKQLDLIIEGGTIDQRIKEALGGA